jgi:hypothetical protein
MKTLENPAGFRFYDCGPSVKDLMKPRSDARLKNLPDERQAQIADFARNHSLAQTVQWLAGQQIKTSLSAVSQFLRWHRVKHSMDVNADRLRDKLAEVVREDPSNYRLDKLGEVFFSISAILDHDPRAWYRVQSLPLRKKT